MLDFSKKLNDVIEYRGVTQAWLADKAKVTEETISRYITGTHNPSLEPVVAIASVLNVSVDYLCGISSNPEPYKRESDLRLALIAAYERSNAHCKDILFTVLSPYMSEKEKELFNPISEKDEKAV